MSNSIGAKIKSIRKQLNISQEALCGEYLSRVSLSKIENNKMIPSIEQLKYISSKLNLPITTFLIEQTYENCNYNYQIEDSNLKKMFENKEYHSIVKYYEFEFEEFKSLEDVNKNYYLGMAFFYLEMYGESLKTLKKYINEYMKFSIELQEKNVILFSYALNNLFKIMLRNSNYTKGEHYLVLATKYLCRYKKDTYLINFIIHSNIAYIYLELNKYNKAISLIEQFFTLKYDFVPIKIVANLHLCLNIAYYNVGDYEKSIENIKKSIWLFSYLGDVELISGCYLNYINALRYGGRYEEAFAVLGTCIKEFCCDMSLSGKFKIQEMILYFNTGKFEDILRLSQDMKVNTLKGVTKINYYFILGHMEFMNKNYDIAMKYLSKCEKGFLREKYIKDLKVLYEDLYIITNNEDYKHKFEHFKGMTGRKNIII